MESFEPSNILIFGATGQIGRHITKSILTADPPFPQVVVFTSPNTATAKSSLLSSWTANGLSVVHGDIHSEADVSRAYAENNIDTVVSCLGRDVLNHQIELLRWADSAPSVKWFFPSEYGTDIEYGPRSKDEKPHQMKLAVRRFVSEEVKNLKVTYLVTGPYADMYFTLVPGLEDAGGYDVRGRRAVVIGDSQKVGFTTMPDVGKGVVAALQHPQTSFDKALKIQSFVVTPREILAEFERQTGGGAWNDVRYTSLEDVRKLEARLWSEKNPFATLATLRRIWAEGGTLYERTDNEAIGLREGSMETLEDAVGRAVRGDRR